VVLSQARIVYGTYGHLNADRSNAILLPPHYMASLRGYEWLIGRKGAVDWLRHGSFATEINYRSLRGALRARL
jgi:homoserine O-acetyltransferase/O-succinyltransferase